MYTYMKPPYDVGVYRYLHAFMRKCSNRNVWTEDIHTHWRPGVEKRLSRVCYKEKTKQNKNEKQKQIIIMKSISPSLGLFLLKRNATGWHLF